MSKVFLSSWRRKRQRKLTNLLSQPVHVQSLDVSSVQPDGSRDGVVESFDESDDGGLSRSRGSDESSGVSSFEVNGQSLPVTSEDERNEEKKEEESARRLAVCSIRSRAVKRKERKTNRIGTLGRDG